MRHRDGANGLNKAAGFRSFVLLWIAIVVLSTAFAFAAGKDELCERDPDHSLQQLVESGKIGSNRIPNDIEFKPLQGSRKNGIWKNTQFTQAFYWPVMNEKFITFGITCPIICDFRIEPKCEVTTPKGFKMLAFRDKYGFLLYVLEHDFVLVPDEPNEREKKHLKPVP